MSVPTHFHFITVVWGEQYVETFLSLVVPNNLSPGNLPAVQSRARSVYKIYTSPGDTERIRSSTAFARLSECMRTEVVAYDDIDFTQNKYAAMSECHRRSIQAAEEDGAAMVFLAPDAIWSDGSFARIGTITATGKRLIAMCGLRVVKDTFTPELLKAYLRPEDGTLTIGARDLVRLSLEHLHPICQQHFWNSPTFASWASLLFWRVGTDGILVRGFHLHPLMVCPTREGIIPEGTVDADYIWRACPDPEDVYVVGDSDEIFACDLSPVDQKICPIKPNTACVENIATFARDQANAQHRRFLTHRIRLHAVPDTLGWEEAEAASDAVISSILELLTRSPPSMLPTTAPPPVTEPVSPPELTALPIYSSAVAPEQGNWRRFCSLRFLKRKLREKGLRGSIQAGFGKIKRRLLRALEGGR